jgi:cytochrome c biogenesis protein CcdA/glutaredoxin-related protein
MFRPNVNFGEVDSPETMAVSTNSGLEPVRALSRGNGNENETVSMAFFFDPNCPCSQDAMVELDAVLANYSNVELQQYNLSEGKVEWIRFLEAYNVPGPEREDTPFLFVGDFYLHHYGVSYENVTSVIEQYEGTSIPLWPTWELAWTMHVAVFFDTKSNSYTQLTQDMDSINQTWNGEVRHIIFHEYDLEDPINVLLLAAYFSEFNISDNIPGLNAEDIDAAFFVGDDFLINFDVKYTSINQTIVSYSGRNTPLKAIQPDLTGGKICVMFFFSPTCGDCHQARKILEKMKGKYPDLDVREYNIADSDNRILQESYFEYYGVPTSKQGTLGVFIGDKYFVDPDKLEEDIEDVIKDKIDGCPCPEVEPDPDVVVDKFTGFTILTVMIAGLIDGINPCAFATLIFFIMYLSMTGRTKKQVLGIGIAYTVGVFITYMALGLGLYALIAKSNSEIEVVSKLLFPIMGVAAIILGIYSIFDYFKARKGKKEEMKLQLPKSIKRLIGRTIKHQVQLRYFALIAIITGVLIALFEFLCTGQVYLPTIMVIVAEVPEYQAMGVLYLLLYNLMFILPLVIIFGAVYFGMSAEQLQDVLDRQRANIKLLFAAVFFGLGIFLLWYSWAYIF